MINMSNLKKTTLYISGMHCPSCEILMKDKIEEEGNVVDVKPDFKKQTVEVTYRGKLNRELINKKIQGFGYEIVEGRLVEREPFWQRFFEASGIAIIVLVVVLIAKEINIIPELSLAGDLSYLTIFIIGLVASTSTCMATSGALYLSLIEKPENQISDQNFRKNKSANILKAVFFNLGRILSYGFFGFLAGLIGQALITDLKFSPFLTLLAAVFMILLGLDLMKIMSIGSVIPSGLNKKFFLFFEEKLKKHPRRTPFLLGAITYILPCGFTQAVQAYALGLGSPLQSALTMMIFALGTTPALFLIGGISGFVKSGFYRYFIKVMGVLVFLVGVVYFSNFMSLYGLQVNPIATSEVAKGPLAQIVDGDQIIEMKVIGTGYSPNYFKVRKGVPVKWKIVGQNVLGCQANLIAPKLNIQKTIAQGEQIVEFVPKEKGIINFSCGMGMYQGVIEVVN